MPPALLFAIILALILRIPSDWEPIRFPDPIARVGSVAIGVLCIGLIASLLGRAIVRRIERRGYADARDAWRYRFARRLVTILSLSYFATTLIAANWAGLIDRGFRLRTVPVIEELAILAPFLAAQLLGRIGLFGVEQHFREDACDLGLARSLARSIRQAVGFLLPITLIYLPGRQAILSPLTVTDRDMLPTFLSMCGMAVVVFALSPLFMRIAWPMASLPPGHLRDRLEFISQRLRFRCKDILVWDAGESVVNAGVTGPLPAFRYVLLSKALIEKLSTPGIEAVFGHEVGHYRLRHLPFYAYFFVAVSALASLAVSAIEKHSGAEARLEAWIGDPTIVGIVMAFVALTVLCVGLYITFGALSRRFERQADLFGARVVSCADPACSPHVDLNDPQLVSQTGPALCRTGASLMSETLRDVADFNHIEADAKDWRHGSIAARMDFLRLVEQDPSHGQNFERGTARVKFAVFFGLLISIVAVWAIS